VIGSANRPVVLLHIDGNVPLQEAILQACRQEKWGLLNLDITADSVPSGYEARGAIVDASVGAPTVSRLRKMRIPVVTYGDHPDHEHLRGLPAVAQNLYGMGRLGANYFIDKGFRNLAFFGLTGALEKMELFHGFRERIDEVAGYRLHALTYRVDGCLDLTQRYENEVQVITDHLRKLPKPLGVLAFNPRMGARITDACEIVGLMVPEEVAVLAREGRPGRCATAPVPLSCISIDVTEMARAMIRLIKRLIRRETGPKRPMVRVEPSGIVTRRSTDTMAIFDPRVAAALRVLWDNIDYSITVDDVARQLKVSRRTLGSAFKRQFGHGVMAEYRKRKLEYAAVLLGDTDKSIVEIAEAVGYSDRPNFVRAFKAAFSTTPSAYRKQSREGAGPFQRERS